MTRPKRTGRWLSAPGAVLCVAAGALHVHADGMQLPLNAAIGVADVIVVSVVERAPDFAVRRSHETAKIRVLEVLKGELEQDTLTVQLHPNHPRALGLWKAGKRYIVFLTRHLEGRERFEVMLDGTSSFDKKSARSIRSAAPRVPRWSGSQHGLASLLIPEKFDLDPGENLDLWIGYRNVTQHDIVLSYRNWPLESHTYWDLRVESDSRGTIAPRSHPHVSQSDIVEYFSANPHDFELTLEPGESYFFPLSRVNSAEHGWGYKERLDFKYYPITDPGRYSIIAVGHHVGRDTLTRAEPLQVWVK
ncbi:MAG: hypothetical protein V3V49_14315 [Candidatus Krumholzibacteria bacterium]